MNLKVSRAVEKLAHLISNGSFNNISRHLLPPPPRAAVARLRWLRRAGYVRINRALFPRRAQFSPGQTSREIKMFRSLSGGVSRACSRRLHNS